MGTHHDDLVQVPDVYPLRLDDLHDDAVHEAEVGVRVGVAARALRLLQLLQLQVRGQVRQRGQVRAGRAGRAHATVAGPGTWQHKQVTD